jgi:hypothetical protein
LRFLGKQLTNNFELDTSGRLQIIKNFRVFLTDVTHFKNG